MSKGRSVKIIMIEDDEGHARLIEKCLRRANLTNEIVPFQLGKDALAYLLGDDGSGSVSIGRPQLVLLDLNLPDMSGIQILTDLKACENTSLTPIIILSTTDDPREIERCYDLGANVYITKPVNYDSFAQAIQQLGLFLSVISVPTPD